MRRPGREVFRTSIGRAITRIFIVAVLLNYPWERVQSSLYVGKDASTVMWWLCSLASLGDGLLVLLIYAVGRVTLRQRDWFEQPGVLGYVFMLAVGLVISVSVEWITVYIAKWWTYAEHMPLVPGLGVGLAPLAQMLVLPPLIFRFVAVWNSRSSGSNSTRPRQTNANLARGEQEDF